MNLSKSAERDCRRLNVSLIKRKDIFCDVNRRLEPVALQIKHE